MADRIQLNEEDMGEVVGGAFSFYKSKKTGEWLCYVDGIGSYKVLSGDAREEIGIMCARNNGLSQQELLDMAKANGYLGDK